MPTDDSTPDAARRQPPGDPRLATLAARTRSLRVELDRLDDQVDLLDRDERATCVALTTEIRGQLDRLDATLEDLAAAR